MADAVSITGLRELERAFRRTDRARAGDLKDALEEAAAPVRRDAQALAVSEISHVRPGDPWAGMRIGTGRSIVYVAPIERGAKSRGDERKRRPKFGTKLMDEAMEPALARNRTVVEARLDKMLDELAAVWERG
jgi:hypothetical protein